MAAIFNMAGFLAFLFCCGYVGGGKLTFETTPVGDYDDVMARAG